MIEFGTRERTQNHFFLFHTFQISDLCGASFTILVMCCDEYENVNVNDGSESCKPYVKTRNSAAFKRGREGFADSVHALSLQAAINLI